MPLLASAQQAPASAPPPPRLEKLEEGEAPAITIRKPGNEAEITEKRAPGGKVTEIKVRSGNSTYYLKPNDPAGSALPGDTESNSIRAAQWPVGEFDLGRKNQKQPPEQAQTLAPAPPTGTQNAPAKK